MADTKLVDQQVLDLEKVIKNDAATPDSKVQYINTIKSGIKQHNVPETCIPHLFEGLRGASSSPHAIIAAAGFTALNHLFTRMSRQDPKILAKEAPRTLALVVEKLGDQRDKLRTLAHQSLTTFHGVAPVDVERFLRNQAMIGKNSRTKEAAMHWILQTHIEQGMPFRAYVEGFMELLEDADGVVRDTAKSTVIELFKNAPPGAKSDLKRQLKNFKVRPAIEQAIVKALVPSVRPETPSEPMGPPPPTVRPTLAHVSTAPVSSTTHDRPATPAETPVESVQPMYINTNRELDETMKDMVPHFDGKESEHNWLKREQSIITLRRLLVGNAPADYHDTFITGLRALLDGITKAINSLRTSLSKEGCSLVQETANTFGPGMDPLVELLMQTLIKLSAGTKKISSSMANTTIDIILGKVTYTPRLMQHLWGVFQDKNVQPRLYSCGWLRTILKKEAHHKHHVEHTGGVDLMEKCIKKGLTDANPGVREKMRPTFWIFWSVWPQRADALMADLDATAQKLLNKDPSNPNSTGKAVEPAARAATGLSKATTRPSIREQVLAQKKAAALANKSLPPRPGSAMAKLSPVRPSGPREAAAAPSRQAGTRPRPESTILGNAGGMSGAPMRPTRKRPEVPRPATAGPYSIRDHPSTEGLSPDSLRQKSSAQSKPAPPPQSSKPQLPQTTPVKSLPRPRTIHVSRTSDFGPTSPSMPSPSKSITSPRISPLKYAKSCIPVSSPSRPSSSRYEELSLVVPPIIPMSEVSSPRSVAAPELHLSRQASPVPPPLAATQPDLSRKTRAETPSQQTVQVYEDPFVEDHQVPPKPDLQAAPVLEEKPVNEGAANLQRSGNGEAPQSDELASPEKIGQNSRLLDSGITKIKAKSLEVHGFRKMQSLIRDGRTVFTDQRFETLLLGLFAYLEDPLRDLPAEKAHDVKAQILTTLKVLLKKERDSFRPHVSRGLEALLQARGGYDARAHVVSGLELLADELVALGSAPETLVVLTRRLQLCTDTTTEGCRTLSMGLHILKVVLDKHGSFVPSPAELAQLGDLASRCLDSTDSGVRMDAVKFCVAFHARVGDHVFWDVMKSIKENPKSLITYYIVKAQRESEA